MANPEHVKVFKAGPKAIQVYDKTHRNTDPGKDYLDLSGADIKGVDLNRAELYNIDFTGCNLENAHFESAYLGNCIFNNTHLSNTMLFNASISGGIFRNCIFGPAELDSSVFSYTELIECAFCHALLSDVSFKYCTISDVNFEGALLTNTLFLSSKILHSKMTGIVLDNTVFQDTELKDIQCDYYFLEDKEQIKKDGISVQKIAWKKNESVPILLTPDKNHYIKVPKDGSFEPGKFEKHFTARRDFEFLTGQVLYNGIDLNVNGLKIEVLKELHDNCDRVVTREKLQGITEKAFHYICILRRLFKERNVPYVITTIPKEGYKMERS